MGIPMLFKIHIVENNQKKVKLVIPLILVWILILPFLVLAIPFLLIAALITWHRGYGKVILAVFPMFFCVMGALPGLNIQVDSPESKTLLYFK